MRQSTGLGAIMLIGALAGCSGKAGPNLPAVRVLSPPNAIDRYPIFSPDGRHIAYIAACVHDWVVAIADSDLSHPIAVDSSPLLPDAPIWSPDGTRVAYSIGTNRDIWIADITGGSPRRLTSGKGVEFPFQWEPNGTWIIYGASGKAGALGSSRVDVKTQQSMPLPAPAQPSYAFRSPGQSQIAYDVLAGGKRTLWVTDSLGAHRRQLTTEGFEDFTISDGPSATRATPWSPDGSKLVYDSRRTGRSDVWVLRVADDSAWQLTRDVRADYAPVWSADGKWIAFLSDRGQQTDVWIIPATGGRPERVTDDVAQEGDLQWIGHGNALAFTTGTQGSALWTHSLASAAERRLTPDSIRVGAYDLSPDRKRIAFVVLRGGGVRDVDIIDIATGARRTLVANGARNQIPVWSPDGSEIAYASNRTGNFDIWVVDAGGGQPRDLTGWPGYEYAPEWSADGKSIYFVADRDAAPLEDLWEVPAAGGEPRRLTHLGTVGGHAISLPGGGVLTGAVGVSQGQFILDRILPDGTLQPLWDRTSVLYVSKHAMTPNGDSIAVAVAAPGGGMVTMLLPTHGGEGRQLLGSGTEVRSWSSDGTRAVYGAGSPNADLYVITVQDSSIQRVTDTPATEGDALFLAGDTSLVFHRSTVEQRIATADVSKLMAAGRSR